MRNISKSLVTVWTDPATNRTLLEQKSPDLYYIPLSAVTANDLSALGAAISDALRTATENPSASGKPAQSAPALDVMNN